MGWLGCVRVLRNRSKITSHNLFIKVLKTLVNLQTECELIFEPTLKCYLISVEPIVCSFFTMENGS